jgi:hypothetical protein
MADILDLGMHRVRGYYAGGWTTGLIGAAATTNAKHFAWRWAPATPNDSAICAVQRIELFGQANTGFAANTNLEFALWRAGAWTVLSTFGTTVSIGADCKKRASFSPGTAAPDSLITGGNIKINTTVAAGLLGDGASLGANPLKRVVASAPASGTVPIFTPSVRILDAADNPLILANNEGFIISSPTISATGTWFLSVNVEWIETEPLAAIQ